MPKKPTRVRSNKREQTSQPTPPLAPQPAATKAKAQKKGHPRLEADASAAVAQAKAVLELPDLDIKELFTEPYDPYEVRSLRVLRRPPPKPKPKPRPKPTKGK